MNCVSFLTAYVAVLEHEEQSPSDSITNPSIRKLAARAIPPREVLAASRVVSATELHVRQIRKAGLCSFVGWVQEINALSRSTLWARPCFVRNSSALYAKGG